MGLGFDFATRVRYIDVFEEQIRAIAEKFEATVTHVSGSIEINFCKMGDMKIKYKTRQKVVGVEYLIQGFCQTNVVGAGFHKHAIDFLDELLEVTKTTPYADVEDTTEYYDRRDFNQLRQEHFYTWLDDSLIQAKNKVSSKEQKGQCIAWDFGNYIPTRVDKTIITHTGRVHVDEILKKTIDELAADFFIWNDEGKTATFYKNTAMMQLWEDCYFMPSTRSEEDREINGKIIANLEKAIELDKTISIPKKEYLNLCKLHDKEPVDISECGDQVSEYEIGYRKDWIFKPMPTFVFAQPGNLLKRKEEDEIVFCDDNPDDYHCIRCSYFDKGKNNIRFSDEFLRDSIMEPVYGEFDSCKYRVTYRGVQQYGKSEYYVGQIEIVAGNLFVTFVVSTFHDQETREFIKKIADSLRNPLYL